MISEPNVNKSDLIELLEDNFDFKVEGINFNPKGWSSWSYFVDCLDGTKYFLKIYKDPNFSADTFDFTYRLFNECGITNIIHPIKTLDQRIVLDFGGFQLVLFNFIAGASAKDKGLTSNQYISLGEILAKVHQSHKIIGPYGNIETFENPHKEKINFLLSKLNDLNITNAIQEELAILFQKHNQVFSQEIELVEEIGTKLSHASIPFVNCHGEPIQDNIMIGEDGDIYLIDWDFPLFAPKEKDLLFFNNHYEEVLLGYKKVNPDMFEINSEVESFYSHLWNVQEIESFGSILLEDELSDTEYAVNLKELNTFLNYSGLKA